MTDRVVQSRLAGLTPLTHEIWALTLALPEQPSFVFEAGQHAHLMLPIIGERAYSIASTPAEAERDRALKFQIRAAPGGGFARLLDEGALVADLPIEVSGPHGDNILDRDFAGPTLLVAGGSGLAPMLAIAEDALGRAATSSMKLIVGMRSERDVYDEARLKRWAYASGHDVEIVLSDASDHPDRRVGLVTDVIASDHADLSGWQAHVAGPPPMMSAVTALLLERGLPERHLHADQLDSKASGS
jgi:NAD(P)H-flavin reductase